MPNKKCLTCQQEWFVCQKYKAGVSAPQLARELVMPRLAIYQILRKHGIPRRKAGKAYRKYPLDTSYFNQIHTVEKAYWLGFLYADGNLRQDEKWGFKVELELGIGDLKHLEKFRESLKTTLPIRYKPKGTCALEIRSKEMYTNLVKHGLTPRKSLTLKPPENLPSHLISHFIRGYLDGDGSISFDPTCMQWYIRFNGTYEMVFWIRKQLMEAVHLGSNKLMPSKSIFQLTYKGNLQIPRLLQWLYKDATVCLNRKNERAMKALNHAIGP